MLQGSEKPVLRVHGLSVRYPGGKLALSDFDLEVRAGELVVVLGGNGSGKTTLLRCVTRAVSPEAGEAWVNGVAMSPLSGERLRRARLQVATVWQHACLVRRRSVLANVASGSLGRHRTFWTRMGRLPNAELDAAQGYLDQVGLRHLATQRTDTLSGGQAQRVAIARALAQRPGLLLADEPVASLDPEAARDVMRLLQGLAHRRGLAVLCVLHQVDLAFAYADRVVGIRNGHSVFDIPRARLSHEDVRRLYLAEAA